MRARAVVAVEEDEESEESDSDESSDSETTASHSIQQPRSPARRSARAAGRHLLEDPKQILSPAKSEQSFKPEPTQRRGERSK